jgi:hypothetical protein
LLHDCGNPNKEEMTSYRRVSVSGPITIKVLWPLIWNCARVVLAPGMMPKKFLIQCVAGDEEQSPTRGIAGGNPSGETVVRPAARGLEFSREPIHLAKPCSRGELGLTHVVASLPGEPRLKPTRG